ncbi:unnamed protein product [Urochloa humidicola]
MGLSRRFLNLIVDNYSPSARSLICIDLKRRKLFDPTTAPPTRTAGGDISQAAVPQESKTQAAVTSNQENKQAAAAAPNGKQKNRRQLVAEALAGIGSTMEKIQLPSPRFIFQACTTHAADYRWNMGCFPLAGRKVLCTDQCGRAFLVDADTRHVDTMPTLHKPKLMPISVFIPKADGSVGGNLFLMESIPQPVARCNIGQPCNDFEVLVYCKDSMTSHCQLFPPPPYIYEPSYRKTRSEISSYAVLNGDDSSLICISVNGIGTYCLDTSSCTWSKVGEWTLPFHGKVEYVPEFNLWFGLSADAHQLAAADLSTMDTQPQPVVSWKELNPPEEWMERQNPQLVSLGSGRFCIARFFKTWVKDGLGLLAVDCLTTILLS